MGQQLENLIIASEMREGVIGAIQNWLINGQSIPADELNLMRKDGSRVLVFSSHIMLINSEGEQEFYCVDIDLSDRKKAEEDLRRAVATSQALIDALPDLIIRINREGIYLDAISPNNMKFSVSPQKIIGNSIFDFFRQNLHKSACIMSNKHFRLGNCNFMNSKFRWMAKYTIRRLGLSSAEIIDFIGNKEERRHKHISPLSV